MRLGILMRRQREKAGLTLIDVSTFAHIGPNEISLIERGRKFPRLKSLFSICVGLDIPLDKIQKGLFSDQEWSDLMYTQGAVKKLIAGSDERKARSMRNQSPKDRR